MPVHLNRNKFEPKGMPQNLNIIKEQILKVLERADSNKDGCFTKDELKKAFKDFGSFWPDWRTYLCLGEVDINNDGKISGKEEIDLLVGYVFDRVSYGHYKIKN